LQILTEALFPVALTDLIRVKADLQLLKKKNKAHSPYFIT